MRIAGLVEARRIFDKYLDLRDNREFIRTSRMYKP